MALLSLWKRLGRKRSLNADDLSGPDSSGLSRCLGLVDLTAIGIGSTLGVGIYVLAGEVAKDTAGPAVVFSFLLAAVVSFLSGLCYAEFGSRMHLTGSAYTYAYVAIGEFIAFVLGWSMLAECIIGASSVAKAWSGYVDVLFNGTFSQVISSNVGTFRWDFLGSYPDFVAFAISWVVTIALMLGAKFSSVTMIIFSVLNFSVVFICIFAGFFYLDLENWSLDGGFFPFGFAGVLKGAAACFYAFVGFDVIAMSSEEAKNPSRDIPLAITLTLVISFIIYAGTSMILTLIVPYFDISASAPLAEAFLIKGSYFVMYLVAVGSMVALTASMLGALFPIPRLTFAMARDGLLCPLFAVVHSSTRIPIINCIVAGALTSVIALLLSLDQLVEMMSIGTLLAYMLVAVSVILLRYKEFEEYGTTTESVGDRNQEYSTMTQSIDKSDQFELHNVVQKTVKETERLFGPREPTEASYHKVAKFTFAYVVTSFVFSMLLSYGVVPRLVSLWVLIVPIVASIVVLALMAILISKEPQSRKELPFKVVLVPYLPLLSISCDIHLMLQLSPATWIRFAVWLAWGLTIYFFYGIWHSKAGDEDEQRSFSSNTTTQEHEVVQGKDD